MDKRIKRIGILAGIVLFLSSIILFIIVSLSKDTIIIASGIKFFNKLKTIILISITASIIIVITTIVKSFLFQHKENQTLEIEEENKKNDPLYDEIDIIHKLENIKSETDVDYKQYAAKILTQIDNAKTIQSDFKEVIENNNQPIIQNIAKELLSIRVHILQDAKSIYRRLVISKDKESIEEKLNHNDKLIQGADELILEAINYIDVKTTSTEVDLKNLTESLKDLIKMM